MYRNILKSTVLALAAVVSIDVAPARADGRVANARPAGVDPLRGANYLYGPYATIRRANEVANIARRMGFRAIVFHSGDGYYVRAWR